MKDMVAMSHGEAGAPATEIPPPAITTRPHRSFCISVAKSNVEHQNVSETICLPIFQFYYFYKQDKEQMRAQEKERGDADFNF